MSARLRADATLGLLATPLAVFLALPVAAILIRPVLDGTLGPALGRGAVLDAVALSLATTAASLALTVLLGTPLAYALARRRFRGARIVESIVDLPIVLPPVVAGLALLLLFGRRGPIGGPLVDLGVAIPFTAAAVVLAQVFVAGPFFVRSARAGFDLVNRDLEDAARVDGADELAVVRHISVPLAAPAMAAGLVMTWARALGEFGATIMFAGNIAGRTQTLPLLVYSEFQSSVDTAIAGAAVLVLAALGVLVAVRLLHWPGRADVGAASL